MEKQILKTIFVGLTQSDTGGEVATKGIMVVVFSFFGYLFGSWDATIKALITFVALDYGTGLLAAWITKEISSAVGFRGLIKKMGIFIMVAMGSVLDDLVNSNGIIRTSVIFFFIANEGISILENWGRAGLPLPEKLIAVLQQLKAKGDGTNEHRPEVSDSK